MFPCVAVWGLLSTLLNGFLSEEVRRCFAGDRQGAEAADRDAAVSTFAACASQFVEIRHGICAVLRRYSRNTADMFNWTKQQLWKTWLLTVYQVERRSRL